MYNLIANYAVKSLIILVVKITCHVQGTFFASENKAYVFMSKCFCPLVTTVIRKDS